MKKITQTLLVASLALVAMSCSKEDKEVVTPTVTENNIPNGTVKMSLNVHVMPSSVGNLRTAGLNGAKVTISNNGKIQTATVDESGLAAFSGLSEGKVSIFVKTPDASSYLSANAIGTLSYDGSFSLDNTGTNGATDATHESTNTIGVELPRLGATLKGKVFADLDFDNSTPRIPLPGAKLIARISSEFEPNIFVATTNSDGTFTFSNLPEEGGSDVNFNISLEYESTNTKVSPNVQKDWFINIGNQTLNYGQVKDLGNIDANY